MCTRPRLGPRSFTRSANVLQALPDVRRLDDLAASIVLTPQLMEPLYAHDQNDLLIGLRLRVALVAELRHSKLCPHIMVCMDARSKPLTYLTPPHVAAGRHTVSYGSIR